MYSASVIINNFNYGQYLKGAIDSVLAQTHTPRNIIVVDDGSTDDSVQIIKSYGNKVIPIIKENGGQASTFNAGVPLAEGDVVFFLDSDDEMLPHAVETVLLRWQPDITMAHYLMKVVDSQKKELGVHPPPPFYLANGDVRELLLQTGTFPTTLTSGMAFSREALLNVMPIDEQKFRMATDGYLVRAVGIQGPVMAINESLAIQRRHGSNDSRMYSDSEGMLKSIRKQMMYRGNELSAIPELAEKFGLKADENLKDKDLSYLSNRLLSLTLDASTHPVPDDSAIKLWWLYCNGRIKDRESLRRLLIDLVFMSSTLMLPSCFIHMAFQMRQRESRPDWLQGIEKTLDAVFHKIRPR